MTQHVNRRSSAFIALVTLIVLIVGAFFIAKAMESKGVEVKVEKTTVLATMTFEVEITDPNNQNNPSEQEILHEGVNDSNCGSPGTAICAVELELNPSNPEIQELLDQIEDGGKVTVQDFLDADNSITRNYIFKPSN